MEADTDYGSAWNSSDAMPSPYNTCDSDGNVRMTLRKHIIYNFLWVVCVFGLMGNGTVVWLLGFRIKRTPFTTYILNLAVADFGVLISSISVVLFDTIVMYEEFDDRYLIIFRVTEWLFHSVYSTSQLLLTTISIDRCVAVVFPLWYRCHRPEKLPTVLCALIWLLSFLVQGTCLAFWGSENFLPVFYAYFLTAVVCLPLITVSTLILFIRFCLKSQQHQRGKLLMAILLALFFFLIFAFPLDVIVLIILDPRFSRKDHFGLEFYDLLSYGLLGASLNSFVNPLLYFFIGRKKWGLYRENLEFVLRRVFTEEEERCREEPETQFNQL